MARTTPTRTVWTLILLLTVPAGCSRPRDAEDLSSVPNILAAVAKRLSAVRSAAEVTALASRGDALVRALTREERQALGSRWLRFRVNVPSVVLVAAPAGSVPFWLDDRGFEPTGWSLRNADGRFVVYRKAFPEGTVGLGVNGLDRTPVAHYAVFVRPRSPTAALTVRSVDPSDCRALPVGPGVSPFADVDRPFAALPPELAGATVIQTFHDRRHGALLVRGEARKTHVPSSPAPDQIVVSFGAEASRSLTWTWRTGAETRGTALRLMRLAPGQPLPPHPTSFRVLRGDSWLVETPNVINDPAIRRHRVAVEDLAPDTTYAASVGDGSESGWSPWRPVRTGPARPLRYSFLYLGDAQNGLESWGKLLHTATRSIPHAGFILLAGDLVDRGNDRTNWDHFFLRAHGVFESVPFLPCPGNHEYLERGPVLYRSFFAPPDNGPPELPANLVYSFEYGNSIIAILDSTSAAFDEAVARRQAEWLDATLARSRATWKIVMFHHPMYASHPTRDYPVLRAAWVPVFDKHRVDLVLQGHDHAYLRTVPLRGGRPANPGEPGTVYVISVSGEKHADQRPHPFAATSFGDTSTYQLIDIDVPGQTLSFQSFNPDGNLVDQYFIKKVTLPL